MLALAAAVLAAVVVWGPPAAPPLERRPETPARRLDVPRETPPAAETPTAPRSRGRTDWIFFFKPGDRLARMGDETPIGYVLSTENAHRFPDGTTGPVYVLWTSTGEERTVDADELERTAKLQ